jgi:hypothetical protein
MAGPLWRAHNPAGHPGFAFGASMALHHGFALADLLAVAADHHDLARRFDAAVGEDIRQRYRAVAAEDRDRARWWGGEPIDVTDPAASLALFLRLAVYRMAPADPRLLRAVARRVDVLDPPDRLEDDQDLHAWPSTCSATRPWCRVPPAARCCRLSPRERRQPMPPAHSSGCSQIRFGRRATCGGAPHEHAAPRAATA